MSLARRGFLAAAGLLAGGLVVGTWLVRRDPGNPLLATLPEGATAFNAHVRIDRDGITLITPRADLGQGAWSVQAAMIAEELDLAWPQFKVDPGPPSATYYNGHALREGLPIVAAADSFLDQMAGAVAHAGGKLLGMQVTGGSTTVADGFDRLRLAGALARHLLVEAAARRHGLASAALTTADSHVLLPDGRRIPYVELAQEARQLPAPAEVTLKPAAQWRLLGKPMQRLDIEAKSTGRTVYGIDLRLPGMLHATVRANPHLGGAVRHVDDAAAKAMRGVVKVVRVEGGVGVIADNTWRAFRAAEALKIEWGPAPYPDDSEAMFEAVAEAFGGPRDSRLTNHGDVDVALAGAAKVIEAEYRVPYLAHAALEPVNATAQWKDGWLDIWTAVQVPGFAAKAAARAADVPLDRVRMHVQIAGGSFGRRLEDDFVRQAAQLAKAHPNAPIQMTWTREEDMTHDMPRPLAMARGRGAVGSGRVQVFDLAIAAPSTAASQVGRLGLKVFGPDTIIVAGAADQPLRFAHHRVTGHRAPALLPVSSWRSVGASGNAFFHECFLDELIHAAGADPLAERLRACTDERARAVLKAAGELANWATPLPTSPEGRRGRGLAFTQSFGVPVAEVVEVTATKRGIRLDRVIVVAAVGRVLDPVNFEAQMQGGVLFGLGHAMHAELTCKDGQIEQTNFHDFGSLRLDQTPPVIVTQALEIGPLRGIGEPPVPPAAPALANAIFAATGQRIRELPLRRHVQFA